MTPLSLMLRGAAVASALLSFTAAASATSLVVTITNTANDRSFSLTPLYTAFHSGSFDAFDEGGIATPGIEQIAELGLFDILRDERVQDAPGSQGGVIVAPDNGVPTIDPGESASIVFNNVNSANRFFSFFSMVVPSNDTFIGNDDPTAYEIFDANGLYTGDRVIDVTAQDFYDAGTEANDLADGAAFVATVDGLTPSVPATGGTVTQDRIALASTLEFGLFNAITTPVGPIDPNEVAFANNPGAFNLARIEIAAIPLPAPAALTLMGIALLGLLRARRLAA